MAENVRSNLLGNWKVRVSIDFQIAGTTKETAEMAALAALSCGVAQASALRHVKVTAEPAGGIEPVGGTT